MAGTFGKLRAAAIAANSITQDRFTSNLSSLISSGGLKISSLRYSEGSGTDVSESGGDTVIIIGSGFNSNTSVYIGTNIATNVNLINSSAISFETPAANIGKYNLYAKNEDGASVIYLPGIEYGEPYTFQGTTFGYATGGTNWPQTPPFPITVRNEIIRFAFGSSISSADIGDLVQARTGVAGQSSKVNGYTSGGGSTIDKFSFVSDANATDVGNLTLARDNPTGQSSNTSGYTSGSSPVTNIIDKFPFASDANATDVGDLTVGRGAAAGQNSTENGYTSGGVSPTSVSNVIDKFPFASDANATDVGNLTQSRRRSSGQSSADSGYTSSGASTTPFPPVRSNVIDKFPFASDANATDVGDVGFTEMGAGSSSTSHGYHMGGLAPYPISPFNTVSSAIERFSFASNENATSVGSLIAGRYGHAGQQY
jgi:hypothetical protein